MQLVIKRAVKEVIYLLSFKGVTQGDPPAMTLFRISVCLLADILRREFLVVLQPWYTDNAAIMGAPVDIAACFFQLQELKPHFDYHTLPSKSWYICSAATEPSGRNAFVALNLNTVKWCRDHRYVGGFVGSAALRDRWVEPQVETIVLGLNLNQSIFFRSPEMTDNFKI